MYTEIHFCGRGELGRLRAEGAVSVNRYTTANRYDSGHSAHLELFTRNTHTKESVVRISADADDMDAFLQRLADTIAQLRKEIAWRSGEAEASKPLAEAV